MLYGCRLGSSSHRIWQATSIDVEKKPVDVKLLIDKKMYCVEYPFVQNTGNICVQKFIYRIIKLRVYL